jgi:hypothetical protein
MDDKEEAAQTETDTKKEPQIETGKLKRNDEQEKEIRTYEIDIRKRS